MKLFETNLRKRARELNLSNSEVARRVGVTERRYGHYVTGAREPNLITLVKIAQVLHTSPDELLGYGGDKPQRSPQTVLSDRLAAAANVMSETELQLFVVQAEAVARLRTRKKPRAR